MIGLYYVTTNGINRVIHTNSGTMQLLDRYTEPDVKRLLYTGEVPTSFNFNTALRFVFDEIGQLLTESFFDYNANEQSMRCFMLAQRYAGLQYLNCNTSRLRHDSSVSSEVIQNAIDFWYPTITTTTDATQLSDYLRYLSEDELKVFDIARKDEYLGIVVGRSI